MDRSSSQAHSMYRVVLFLLLLINACAYRVLVVFPYPAKSHSILGEGYVRLLLEAGHDVTYITPFLLKPHTKLRQIDVSYNRVLFPMESTFNLTKLLTDEIDLRDTDLIFSTMQEIANSSIMNTNVQELILDPKEHFDVVVVEWLYSDLYSGFSAVFSCPFIWSSSMEPHAMVLRLIDDIPNTAYTPDHMSTAEPPFTFKQRFEELWRIFEFSYTRWHLAHQDEAIYKYGFGPAVTKRRRKLPPYDQVKFNGSLMFGNSHVSSGLAIRLPQNYVSIAGYHVDPKLDPLSEDLQKIMDNARHGVIYFSMGSMMKGKTMSYEMKREFLKTLGSLQQTVIWKLEETLPNLPKNVHIVHWAPQRSILAHPNCVLFITHGGLLSTIETLHFGVPIIGIPLYADQFINVKRAVSKGFAVEVNLSYNTPAKLKLAIEEILVNPKYKERVKEVSMIYHDRPTKPGQLLVHWVEHVAKTRGAPHFRSPALNVPWYQKMYLDVIVVIVLIIIVGLKIVSFSANIVCGKKVFKVKWN